MFDNVKIHLRARFCPSSIPLKNNDIDISVSLLCSFSDVHRANRIDDNGNEKSQYALRRLL